MLACSLIILNSVCLFTVIQYLLQYRLPLLISDSSLSLVVQSDERIKIKLVLVV